MKILPLFIIALLTLCLSLFISSVFAYSSKTITVGSSPAGIAINTKTKEIYVADSSGDSNSISVINASNIVIKTIKAGLEPLGIAVNENTNMIYVTDFGESKVSVVNGTYNRLVANVTVGFQPGKIRINPITNMIYTIQQGAADHSISVINGTTNLFVKKIELGSFETTGIDVDAQKNLVYVTYRINPGGNQTAIGEVSVIDGKTNTIVKTIQVGSAPQDIAVNPNTNMIYVTDDASENDVLSINGITFQIVNTIPLPAYPTGLGVNTRTNTIFAANEDNNTVSMINGTDDSFVSTISGFNCPTFIGMNSNKSEIYVNNYCGNTVRKIDVTCKEGLQLITKAEDNSPACVKPQTAQRLVEHGWGHISADFYTKYASQDITAKFQSEIISREKAIQIVQDYINENNLTLAVNTNSSEFKIDASLKYVQLSSSGFAFLYNVDPKTGTPLQETSLNGTDSKNPRWWVELEKDYLGMQNKRNEDGHVVWAVAYEDCRNCIASYPMFMVDAITGKVIYSENG